MPAVQTTYNERTDNAREGMIANEEPSVLISRTIFDAAGVGFGKVVMQPPAGAINDEGCTAVLNGGGNTLTADKFIGITVRERNVRPEMENKFDQYQSARIMRKGVIWVMTGGAVAAGGGVVTVDTTTGVISATAASGTQIQITRARWETTTTGVGLAKLRLD